MKPNHPYPKLRGAKRGRKKADLRAARTTLLNEPEAMAKVTWLYYHRKLTQEQVAQELGLSRPVVMRLLRQATEEGLVTLSLRADVLQRLEGAAYLAKQFDLREVFIVPTSKTDTEADVMRAVGKAGALYLQATIRPEQILAVAWGRTIFEVARALENQPVSGLVVAQTFGGLNGGEFFNPSQVTSLVAEKLHARVYHLYVPALVATPELRDVLLADPGIRAALEVARQASCFLAGIGKVENNATFVQTGFLDLATVDRLRARGAVGDISGRFFDLQGQRVLGDVEERIMGLSWEDLRQLKNVVAVACGPDKTEAILGALRTGLLDFLITDDQTVGRLLKCLEHPSTRASDGATP